LIYILIQGVHWGTSQLPDKVSHVAKQIYVSISLHIKCCVAKLSMFIYCQAHYIARVYI